MEFNYSDNEFYVSELASNETIALPIYPELTKEQIGLIKNWADSLNSVNKK